MENATRIVKLGRRYYISGDLPGLRGFGIKLQWDSDLRAFWTGKKADAEAIERMITA